MCDKVNNYSSTIGTNLQFLLNNVCIRSARLFGYLPFESPAAIQEANISKALDDTGAAGKRVSQQGSESNCAYLGGGRLPGLINLGFKY